MSIADSSNVDRFLLYSLSNSTIKKLYGSREVVSLWTNEFRRQSTYRAVRHEHTEEDEPNPRWRKGRRDHQKPLNRGAAFENVTRQKQAIVTEMRKRDFTRMWQYITKLVEYQRKNGELELPVKSLCDLAREAKGLHLFLLQLELTQQAIEIKADDGWAWIQHGDALLNSGRLEDALEAYQQAETYGEHLFSKTGRAEVLKALGRLDEALGAYDDVIAEHREDVVARNGRASVLATMGRYQEALKGLPSQNPVTQNDWIGYHIRGIVLMLTRHFDAAIQIFEDGVVHDPRPASQDYFRTTLAVAHIRQKEYAKVSKVLSEVHSPGLVVPANALRFHTLGALGHRDEATALYSSLRDVTTPIMVDLREELHRRYITNEEPMHSDDWIFNTEIRCLMLAV